MQIKKIRLARGITQKKLANLLSTTQQSVGRWENNQSKPSIDQLKDMAVIFKCSVDSIINSEESYPKKIRTTEINYLMNDEFDGYWGNIGVLVNGFDNSKWYPITQHEKRKLEINIYNGANYHLVKSLNNRALFFNIRNITNLRFLDEAIDNPLDDWDVKNDDIIALDEEIYRGLTSFYENEGFIKGEQSDSFVKKCLNVIENFGLQDEFDLKKFVHSVRIYNKTGLLTEDFLEIDSDDEISVNSFIDNYYVDPEREELDKHYHMFRFISDVGEERFFSLNNISYIDMPLIKYEEAAKLSDENFLD